MEITFTRTGGRDDWISVYRDDGTPLRWPWPSADRQLPHDLVHFVVETDLRMSQGFWGRVAAGADFGTVSELADRLVAGDRGEEGSTAAELAQVEGIVQAVLEPEEAASDEELVTRVTEWCQERQVPAPESLCALTLARIRSRLRTVEQQWRALAVGQSLIVSYVP